MPESNDFNDIGRLKRKVCEHVDNVSDLIERMQVIPDRVQTYSDIPLAGRNSGTDASRSQLKVQGAATIDLGVHWNEGKNQGLKDEAV